jgi:hypothetical protein
MDETQKQKALDNFEQVLYLYQHFRSQELRPKRCMMSGSNHRSDALDFVIDVELKAKRALGVGTPQLAMFLRIASTSDPQRLPEYMRRVLGEAFESLGPQGCYGDLYFSAKRSGYLDRQNEAQLVEHSVVLPEGTYLETLSSDVEDTLEGLFEGTQAMPWDSAQQ